jgi:hypothetical protein
MFQNRAAESTNRANERLVVLFRRIAAGLLCVPAVAPAAVVVIGFALNAPYEVGELIMLAYFGVAAFFWWGASLLLRRYVPSTVIRVGILSLLAVTLINAHIFFFALALSKQLPPLIWILFVKNAVLLFFGGLVWPRTRAEPPNPSLQPTRPASP